MHVGMDEAIARFELITRRMAEAVEARTVEERGTILSLRKDNIESIDRLHDAAIALLAQFPAVVRYEIEREFEEKFQAMRRVVTLHQGKWPAVLIAEDPEGFRESARRARDAKAGVLGWIKRELLPRV